MDIITTIGTSNCQRTYIVFPCEDVYYLCLGDIYTYRNYKPVVKGDVSRKAISKMYSNSKRIVWESNL